MFGCQLTKRIIRAKKAPLHQYEEKQIQNVMKSISKKSNKESLKVFYIAIIEENANTRCVTVQRYL